MKFVIKNNKVETLNKSVRFPVPLIKEIEEVMMENDISFTRFVVEACQFVLMYMKKQNSEEDDQIQ
ncbi:MAG: hypothetical protein IJI66_08875 [Erysipelotrichaceae bacterium]|jgi:hypothetical protein|nr:hypothetical protein [Erysipelotrichaceae bacterium]